MSDERAEVVETEETEAVSEKGLEVIEPITHDGMDAVIAVAEKMEAYSKAMDTITNAIIKRSYPGDWVVHAKETDPDDKKRANIGAAAAERIATFLGIQERNWTAGSKEWSDDRKHYTWIYEADFGFKNRWVHAIGKAGTRDKFFGVANGQQKAIEDIQEDHIRTAAFRACRKEGVRLLLGLRAIPVKKLIELGYDPAKINYVGFADRGKQLDQTAKETSKETGMAERVITIVEIVPREGVSKAKQTPYRLLSVRDTEGVIWQMWSQPGGKGKREAILVDSLESKSAVKINFQVDKDSKGVERYTIVKVNGATDE